MIRSLLVALSCLNQEWDEKAKEAKNEYLKAMEEYNKNKPSDSEPEDDDSRMSPSAKSSKAKPKSSPKKRVNEL